jgi:hypothetical protein
MLLSVANDGHLFSWNIYQRKTQLGVRLTEGGFTSFHAAHEAGSKALAEEWHDELRPSPGGLAGLRRPVETTAQ